MLRNGSSRCILRENKVVGFILLVAGKAGFHERRIHGFVICVEITEPPASRRGVLPPFVIGGIFSGIMMLGGFVKQVCQSCDVHE